MKLVIVESPAKAKTIEKYLGKGYSVMASVGHVRDLPKSNKDAVDIEGGFVPRYVVSPDKTHIFSIVKNGSKGLGIVSLGDGTKKTSFDLPISEFASYWATSNLVTLTTKASAFTPGFAYTLNTVAGSLSRVLGGIQGLTTKMSLDGTHMLFADNNLSLSVFDIAKGEKSSLPVKTLPEKCVWSTTDTRTVFCAAPSALYPGEYPDVWYQGLVSFTDTLWKINTETGEKVLVADFSKQGTDIDVVEPSLTAQDAFLLFLNKKDSSLWVLSLVSGS